MNKALRLTLSTSFSMESSRWNMDETNTVERSRNECNILVQELEARLDVPLLHEHPLEFQEFRLYIGSSLKTSRRITAHQQYRNLLNISISGASNYQVYGVSLGTGYPQVALLGAMAKRGEMLNRPPISVGLELKNVQVGIDLENQLYGHIPSRNRTSF